MKTASYENCKRLHELTGWDNNAGTSSKDRLRVWVKRYSLSEMGMGHPDYETTPPKDRNTVNVYEQHVTDDPRHMLTTGQEVFKWWYSEVRKLEEAAIPAYDLDYLVCSTPLRNVDIRDTFMLGRNTDNTGWSAVYRDFVCIATEPADAVCQLLIKIYEYDTPKA